jgi:hypothetical protein
MFALVALAVVASILAHSSTDVLIARWLETGSAARDSGSGQRDVG